jgi:hypothetical protein
VLCKYFIREFVAVLPEAAGWYTGFLWIEDWDWDLLDAFLPYLGREDVWILSAVDRLEYYHDSE